MFTATQSDFGNYTVGIVLTDINPNSQSSYYNITFSIYSPFGKPPTVDKRYSLTVGSIGNFGELVIKFSNLTQPI